MTATAQQPATPTMQDKLLTEIISVITAAGLDTARQPQFANTGVLYAQRGLDTFLSVRYDFQDHSCSFGLTGPAVDARPPLIGRALYREHDAAGTVTSELKFRVEYHKGGEVRAVLDLIRDLLAPWARGEPDPAVHCYPQAVVVDTRAGYVYTAAADGQPFTAGTGQAFADLRNAELDAGPAARDQPYQVFRLTAAGDGYGPQAEAFVRAVASLTLDSERPPGDEHAAAPRAAGALQSLITHARALRDGKSPS
jgi:hypothetical protein